jgi:hypothetical protein
MNHVKRVTICLSVFCSMVLLQSFGSQTSVNSQDQASALRQTSKQSKSASINSRAAAKLSRRMLGSNPPSTQIGFLSAPQVATGGSDYSTYPGVVGNFNGAGKLQGAAMLVDTGTSTPAINICVTFSNGNGGFTTALTPLGTTVATESDVILAGDVNGDGYDDIIVLAGMATTTPLTPATMSVWLNKADGSGTFVLNGSATQITTNSAIGATLVAAKPDTHLDLIVADNANPGNIWTVKGNGDGTFQAPTSVAFTGTLSPYSTVAFADFNGDGFLDFAGSNGASGSHLYQVEVYLNNGANTGYNAPIALSTPSGKYESCFNLAGDLSGQPNNQADIVVANCDNGIAGRESNLLVYVNNGNGTGTFANSNTGTAYSSGAWPAGLSIADMNGDGKNDLLVSDQQAGGVAVLLGNGDGTLQGTPVLLSYAAGGGPRSTLPPLVTDYNPALVADFNGDGLPDAMLPDFRSNFTYLQGYGDGTFRSSVNYYAALPLTSNGFPTSVGIASGDFNGDGIPDFVIGNSNGTGLAGGITVFLSNADGSMNPGVTYPGTAAGAQLSYVVVADFNGDHILDIAATDAVNGGVQIFTGVGDGTFIASATYPTDTIAATTLGIVTADFNGDGHPDLAVVNQTSSGTAGDVGVLLNGGTGTFGAPTNYPLSTVALEITAADLGNKQSDLIVPLFGTGNTIGTAGSAVALFLGKGDGTFTAQSNFQLVNGANTFYQPVDAAIGDLNGDGIPDLIVGTDDQVPTSFHQGIVVALGNGNGTFQTPNLFLSSPQTGPDPMGVQLIDLNRDGKLDVIAANYKNGTVAVLYGKGDGTLYDPVEYVSSLEPLGLALADVNGDGAIDAITAGDGNGFSGVNVLLNASGDSTSANSSTNPSVAGEPVTFTATVAGSKVRGVTTVPTGTVTFFDGTTVIGQPVPLASGVAQLSAGLTVGSHSITAQYSGDVNYLPSTSPALVQVVNQSSSSTVLKSSANPAGIGSAVTFTATVASTVSGDALVPTGSVTFFDSSTNLGSAALNSSGQASLGTSSLAVGTHSITAQYGGDTNFTASTSSALSQVITPQPDYSLSANPTSQTVSPGSGAAYAITLTPSNGYDGTVTFACPAAAQLPTGVTCTLPSPVVPAGKAVTLTLNTTGPNAMLRAPAGNNSQPSGMNLWASLGSIGVFGLMLTGDWKKRKHRRLAIVLGVLAVVMILALVGCGGGSSTPPTPTGGTPAGTYTVTVTATGTAGTNNGNTQAHTLNLTLIVN